MIRKTLGFAENPTGLSEQYSNYCYLIVFENVIVKPDHVDSDSENVSCLLRFVYGHNFLLWYTYLQVGQALWSDLRSSHAQLLN